MRNVYSYVIIRRIVLFQNYTCDDNNNNNDNSLSVPLSTHILIPIFILLRVRYYFWEKIVKNLIPTYYIVSISNNTVIFI